MKPNSHMPRVAHSSTSSSSSSHARTPADFQVPVSQFPASIKNTMSILHMPLSVPVTAQSLSSSKALSSGSISFQSFPLTTKFSDLSLRTTPIRMGGGPRTYPGGVSKWQWKRMQAKKAKQLLQARLARERQIYEMRKRAELKAAVSELERPWEIVEKPPNLFSVDADEQLKVLADRFQKPGGFDMWSEKDGPELFRPETGMPSSRFFPKGVVHSVKPYGKLATVHGECEGVNPNEDSDRGPIMEKGLVRKDGELRISRRGLGPEEDSGHGLTSGAGLVRKYREPKNSRRSRSRSDKEGEGGNHNNGKLKQEGNRRSFLSGSQRMHSGSYNRSNETNPRRGGTNGELSRSTTSREKVKDRNTEVFDMSLQDDGIYGVE